MENTDIPIAEPSVDTAVAESPIPETTVAPIEVAAATPVDAVPSIDPAAEVKPEDLVETISDVQNLTFLKVALESGDAPTTVRSSATSPEPNYNPILDSTLHPPRLIL